MPLLAIKWVDFRLIASPAIENLPAGNARLAETDISSVDLPAPLAPISATVSPSLTVRETCFRAWIGP